MKRENKKQNQIDESKLDNASLNKGRRKSLIGASAAVGAAAVWHKPIMNNVVLPAHAQTTNPMAFSLTTTADQVFPQGYNIQEYFPQLSSAFQKQGKSVLTKIVDIIVPPAMAGFGGSSSEDFLAFYLAPDGAGTYTFQFYAEGPYRDGPGEEDVYPDCIVSLLFQADGLSIGGTRPAAGTSCLGFPGIGVPTTLISLADDGSTASISFDGSPEIELMADPAATAFSIVPCSCVIDIENTTSNVITDMNVL